VPRGPLHRWQLRVRLRSNQHPNSRLLGSQLCHNHLANNPALSQRRLQSVNLRRA
jgi:hypothetical protein